jgi:hypothetical protein
MIDKLLAAAQAGRSGVNLATLTDAEILAHLRKSYDAILDEPVPDEWKELLAKLK